MSSGRSNTLVCYVILALYVLATNWAKPRSLLNSKHMSRVLSLALLCLGGVAVWVTETGVDMSRYWRAAQVAANRSLPEYVHLFRYEPGFLVFQWLAFKLVPSFDGFRLIVALGIWGLTLWALGLIVRKNQIAYVFFAYLNFFYFWTFSTNVIRQGLASGCVLLAMGFFLSGRPWKSLVSLISAMSFHLSSVVGLGIYVVDKLNFGTVVAFWGVCAVLFISGLNVSVKEGVP